MLTGYLWASTDDQDDLAAQRRALAAAGCEQVVEDRGVGRSGQPELHRVLSALRPGDVLIIAQLDGLGRSLPEVVRCVRQVAAVGAALRSLKEGIDTTTDAGRAALALVSSLAALNPGIRPERSNSGAAAVHGRGRKAGRRPKLTAQQRLSIADEVLSGRSTGARVARRHDVSEATISRVMAAHRPSTASSEGRPPDVVEGVHGGKIAGVLAPSVLDERLAIVGTSGSGKTYAAKGLVERLMGQGARVCIVDPLGVWWGLRAAPGGTPSGYPVVVFGGLRRRGAAWRHGPCPRQPSRHAPDRLCGRPVRSG